MIATSDSSSWQAELNLAIERRGDRSVLARRSHYGPLGIQRAFYPEGAVPHLYLLHPPGGVVGGDQLRVNVTVAPQAHALVTTPAAGKFYRCAGRRAGMVQQLDLQAGAALEWLPQETIIYAGAEADTTTRVNLAAASRFIGWEMICLGRPAAQERFVQGRFRQRFELWREGKPLWLERAHYAGNDAALTARWGLAGFPVAASLVLVGELGSLSREQYSDLELHQPDEALAITRLDDDVLVCRYLGQQAQQARQRLAAVWRRFRPVVMQREACEPRVWNT